MKLKNLQSVEKFISTVEACTGNVYLKSTEGDVFNLKSSMSRYVAIGKMISESANSLELFADRREDEARLLQMIKFMPDCLSA